MVGRGRERSLWVWKDLDKLEHGKGGEVFGTDSAPLCLSEEQQGWSFLINKHVSLVFRVLGTEPGALCYQASLLPLSYVPQCCVTIFIPQDGLSYSVCFELTVVA